MDYGLRIKDMSGNTILLTADLSFIHSAGRNSMPSSLSGDNTYGSDIDLPGSSAFTEANLSMIAVPRSMNIDLTLVNVDVDGFYAQSWFMNNSFTFYTRNESTGVMTVFTPDKSATTAYDGVLGVYPRTIWDKMGAVTFTACRLFAAMCYELYDQSASAFKQAYAIGATQGIVKADYIISLRRNVL